MAYEVYLDDVAEKLAAMGIDINDFNLIETKIDPEFVDEEKDESIRFVKEKASNSTEEFASFLFYDLINFDSQIRMK